MKFSAQEEFGLRCLLQIARLGPEGSMTIPDVSRVEGMTQTHVAKLMMILRKSGFIRSTRGHLGGYTLALPADQIRVGDVLEAGGFPCHVLVLCGIHAGKTTSQTIGARHSTVTADLPLMTTSTGTCP